MEKEKNLAGYLLGVLFFWGVVIMIVLLSSLPYNPLTLPFRTKVTISTLLPQGWGFFTRNPREPRIFFYKKFNDVWSLQTLPNSHYLLGASREMRVLGVEINYLMEELKGSDKWIKCSAGTLDSIPSHVVSIKNQYENPLLCGDIIFKIQEPVPWAWSRSEVVMPYKLIRLHVTCTN